MPRTATFLEELRFTLGLTARQGVGQSAVRLKGRSINGAQVLYYGAPYAPGGHRGDVGDDGGRGT